MSVHQLAHHLQSAGRGDDKVLVHMTPKEVGGLQALAMAHGGSLTINPHTGLPEAGFLKSILPMVAGLALAPMTAGTSLAFLGATPFATALTVGGITGLATGSLKDGLMAGLGAYGGASLGAGLAGAGATTTNAANAANATKAANIANATNATNATNLAAVGPSTSTVANSGALSGAQTASLSQPLTVSNASSYTGGLPSTVNVPSATQVGLNTVQPAVQQSLLQGGTGNAIEAASAAQTAATQQAAAKAAAERAAAAPTWENMGKGFRDVTSSGEKAWNFVKDNPMPFIGLGVSALSGMNKNKGVNAPEPSASYIRPYDYSVTQDPNAYVPNASTAERSYFTEPRFTARPIERIAKEGGLMALSKYGIGGEVEQMSARNSVSGNTMYPQSQLQTAMYSNPMVQRPVQNDVITAGLDTPTQPYSGEMRMASGGVANPTGGGAVGNGAFGMGLIAQLLRQGAFGSTAPTAPTSYTAPAALEPYMPSGQTASAPDTSMVPNISIPQTQAAGRQSGLGLGDFYANMNQQLAQQGGYGGYAAGGVARYGFGGLSKGSKSAESTSEKKYSYDPETMKFTETTTTTPAAQANRFGMHGLNFAGLAGGLGPYAVPLALAGNFSGGQQSTPQPTVTTETSGGIAKPFIPEGQTAGAPDTSMVPNIQLQPLRTPEQQLGLEGFYSNMNQHLAEQGGYAAGGVARYNVGGSLTPWATGSSYNPGVPIASGQLYLGNPPPMASAPAKTAPSEPAKPYVAPAALDPYIPKGQTAGNPDMSMVPNIQLQPLRTPEQQLGLENFYASMNRQLAQQGGYGGYAAGGMADGGVSHLGDYSDGGRLLKGPGDGVSDSIPASIGNRQPARLADGEFVVPARIVSELGNGSTEAGARKLYQMMERVQNARRKTVGKNQVAKNNKAEKLMPA